MSNNARLWIVASALALVVITYLLSYLVGLDRAFDISETDLGLMRGRLEGVATVLGGWLLEKLGIARSDRLKAQSGENGEGPGTF